MNTSTRLFFAAVVALSLGFTAYGKTPDGKPCVLLLAGKPSHGPGEHEHNAGVKLLAKCLYQGAPDVVTKVHLNADWPNDDELAQADTVVIYSDGQGGHVALMEDRLGALKKEMDRGCGLVCLHYAVEPIFAATGWAGPQKGPDGKPLPLVLPPERGSNGKGSPEFLEWLGGYFEQFWSVNPHWLANFTELPKHPISNGVKPFSTNDEWYFHMRFRPSMKGVTPILTALAPPETMNRPEGDHGGNPDVKREVLEEKKPQHVAWAAERANGGRGFGFTGGHFHQGWGHDDQRKLVLNAILWTAKAEVPLSGVESKLTEEDLTANLDSKPPRPPKPAPAPPAPAPPTPPSAANTEQPNPEIAARYGLDKARANMSTFQTPAGLKAALFAAEPMIQNPTNIEVDQRGRIWATECVNYRTSIKTWGTLRAEGDRVVILEDTDGDGLADKETTFYQSPELTNPLGLCVLPGPGGAKAGTQVIVSAAPNVWLLTDTDGDDKADKAEIILKVGGGWDHDHQIHAFSFAMDGKLYFDMGNEAKELRWPSGELVVDVAGNPVTSEGKPYRQGMVFRADLAGGKLQNIETLGWNFRNNYEVAVDSFGTMWQSDNDDDGNKGVRINYVMDYGNYGYTDEMTGAGWRVPRTNLETEIPLRHWHLNDPGTVPNLLQTGSGSPTGILVNEGTALGTQFTNQLIHCDAGPRTVRAYPVENDGAGYKATMVDILTSSDQWYRPADVAIAPDGSLYVADWYDPGVGGHNMGDHEAGRIMGRLYRVAGEGAKPSVPAVDFSTAAGAVAALESPNKVTQYIAWQKLHALGTAAEPELLKLWTSANPRLRARALGVLTHLSGSEAKYLAAGLKDSDADVRIAAIRLTRQLAKTAGFDTTPLEEDRALVGALLQDTPQVRREIALSLNGAKKIAPLWAALARQHDGRDRWYLEALGIGAAGNDDECFDTWLAAVKGDWNTPAGRDIIWRLRSTKAAGYLAKILEDQTIAETEKPRYLRSFDFLPEAPEKNQTLVQLAGLGGQMETIAAEALTRLKNADLNASPEIKAALDQHLASTKGTPRFIGIVRDFRVAGQGAAVLDAAVKNLQSPLAADALKLLIADPDFSRILDDALASPQAEGVVTLLGSSSDPRVINRLKALAIKAEAPLPRRSAAIQALARSQTGAQAIIQLAKNNELPADLSTVATTALNLVQYPTLKTEIATLFPTPSALGGQPLPPIAELVKIKGDVARGKVVFERAESSCVTCHRINDKGVDFAPALSEIGSKLPKEALFEAIINPNAGISMGFETTQLETKSGTVALGIVRSDTNEDLVLALPGGATANFTKREISKREKLPTSLMPSGLNQALTQQDLVDLVGYLVSLIKP
jgi:putative membrane-bound dehydrogenase-like protein